MKKAPKSTSRGVIVIDKSGKVTALEQGGPQRTVDVVMDVLPKGGPTASGDSKEALINGQANTNPVSEASKTTEASVQGVKAADTAAEVADSAEQLDKHVQLGPTA